jgi:PhnB protein
MLADDYPEFGIGSAIAIGGTSVTVHLDVDSADDVVNRALQLGATIQVPLADRFYGERSG